MPQDPPPRRRSIFSSWSGKWLWPPLGGHRVRRPRRGRQFRSSGSIIRKICAGMSILYSCLRAPDGPTAADRVTLLHGEARFHRRAEWRNEIFPGLVVERIDGLHWWCRPAARSVTARRPWRGGSVPGPWNAACTKQGTPPMDGVQRDGRLLRPNRGRCRASLICALVRARLLKREACRHGQTPELSRCSRNRRGRLSRLHIPVISTSPDR